MRHDGRRAGHQQGFTLIEILLVVVIIGILMGVAVVSINPQDMDRRLLRARDRLQSQIQYAHVLADTDQVEMGVQLLDQSWRFLRFDRNTRRWLIITDDPALKPDTFPGMTLTWQDQSSAQTTGAQHDAKILMPDFLILSSGEATPGIITLQGRDDGRQHRLQLMLTDMGEAVPAEAFGHAP